MAELRNSILRRSGGPSAIVLVLAVLLGACGGDAKGPPVARVAGIEIESRNLFVELADTAMLRARVISSTGGTLHREVEWRCSRPDLVVNCGPQLIPLDTGTLVVAARVETFVDTATIRIYEEGMQEIVVSDPFPFVAANVVQGSGLLVKLQVRDSTGVVRNDRRIIWQSSDSAVAMIRDTTWWSDQKPWPGGALHAVGPGTATLRVRVGGVETSLDVIVRPRLAGCDAERALSLDLAVGELVRFRGSDAGLPSCFQYRHGRDAGRKYVIMVERLPVASGIQSPGTRGLFQVSGVRPADSLIVQLYTPQISNAQLLAERRSAVASVAPQHGDHHGEWTVAGHRIRELPPDPRPSVGDVRRSGAAALQAHAAAAALRTLAAGDTLVIDKLRTIAAGDAVWTGTGSPSDRAVIRFVGENLVIAEHLEMFDTRLRRFNGHPGSPMPEAMYAELDAAYRHGRTQLDRLFGAPPAERQLAAVSGTVTIPQGRELVVNTILPRGVWGTATGDAAYFDFWIDTDGVTPAVLQDRLLLANQLITHELAHVRHFQLQPQQQHLLWSVEGIARFAEHLAFAATVLQSETPSRTGNVVAGAAGYPSSPQLRYTKEMPATLGLETNFFGGYGGAAYIFDYIADHVEAAGGDGLRAVRDILFAVAGQAATDAMVDGLLREATGATTLDELLTRARLALFLDNFPTRATLPQWTQYLQFNVRASRPWFVNWPQLAPGADFSMARQIGEGVVWGVVIDGDRASGDQDFLMDMTRGEQGVLSVVRIQ